MIFQDSGAMMNPTRKVGKVFTEYILTHEKISKKEAWSKGIAMLERMRLPSPDNIMESLSFPVIRWYETASWYCDGNDLSAEASSCR